MTSARAIGVVAGLAALACAGAVSSAGGHAVAKCPASDRHALTSARAGATRELVPAGATQLLLCRYGGLNDGGAAFKLLASPALLTDPATVARFARELDALTPTTGVYSCPADSGRAIVAHFGYASAPDDPVTVGLDGCNEVTNGHVRRTAGVQAAGRGLIAALEARVPRRRS